MWSLGSLRRFEQRFERKSILYDGRFQHDVAEILFDPNVALEQIFHPLLIVVDVAANEAQQIIVTAADKVTFHQLVDVAHIGLELYEIFLAVIDQGDLGEDRYAFCQLGKVDLRAVACDVSAGFETLDTLQARARRKTYRIRQVGIRHPSVLLQLDEDIQVDPIKLRDAIQRNHLHTSGGPRPDHPASAGGVESPYRAQIGRQR
jgi:hypothetical protein